MQIFFYAASATPTGKRCYQQIVTTNSAGKCIELPAGCEFNTPLALQLTSGDILLLFAAHDDDLQHLQLLSDDLEGFQTILILGSSKQAMMDKGYRLNPRLVCQIEQDLPLLEQFIDNISNRFNDRHLKDNDANTKEIQTDNCERDELTPGGNGCKS